MAPFGRRQNIKENNYGCNPSLINRSIKDPFDISITSKCCGGIGMSTHTEKPPSQQKYKANENTSRHKLQAKEKTINKNHVKILCKDNSWLQDGTQQ